MENKLGGQGSAEEQMKKEEALKVKIKQKKRPRRPRGVPHSPMKSFDFPIS